MNGAELSNFHKGALFAGAGLALAVITIAMENHLTTVVGAAWFIVAFALEVLAIRQLRVDGRGLR